MLHNPYTAGTKPRSQDLNLEQLINLEEGEKILLEVRRHMFILYGKVALLLIFFFVPLALSPALGVFINKLTDGTAGPIAVGFFFLLWCLFLWVLFFFYWTDYYLDVWIVTNRRIFDIEQKGVFRRDVSVTRLEQVQDVTVSVDGIFATFMHFGNIHIHTAGSEIDFTIKNAANPMHVKETIMRAHGEAFSEHNSLRTATSQPQQPQ